MMAEVVGLTGKYYGTILKIVDDSGYEYTITLWNSGSYEPSSRELGGRCTIEQWRKNELLPAIVDKFYPNGVPAKEAVEICDSHFESRETYELAVLICALLTQQGTS